MPPESKRDSKIKPEWKAQATTIMKPDRSRPMITTACVLIGSLMSGYMSGRGACAAGHDPRAGWPFPDLKGMVFFWAGALVWPVITVCLVKLVFIIFPKIRFPKSFAILLLSPLLAYPAGSSLYRVHVRNMGEDSKIAAEHSKIQRAKSDALYDQLVTEPEIVLRERWFVWDPGREPHHYLFLKSLKDPDVPYTSALLDRIYRASPETQALVVAHSACDASFLASHWPDALCQSEQGKDELLIAMIQNPKTPVHLVEELETSTLVKRRQETGDLKLVIDVRLHKGDLVMTRGCRIQANTETARISIYAFSDLARGYEWKDVNEDAVLSSLKENGPGGPSLYFYGSTKNWREHDGTTGGEFREGRKGFQSPEQALQWIRQQSGKYPTVYRNDGLLVSCGKDLERKQITVEVWQILIIGNKPATLPGSDDSKITFSAPDSSDEAR